VRAFPPRKSSAVAWRGADCSGSDCSDSRF
jgi:hypothetical protein